MKISQDLVLNLSMENLKNLSSEYLNEFFWDLQSDSRTSKWFMMSSPFPVLGITIIYVVITQILVPNLMKNRKPLNVKPALRLYNLWHFAINIVFFYYFSSLGWLTTYSWRCEPVNRSPVGDPMTIATVGWWFLMFKFVDLFETLILACGKRHELISHYHVVHHFLMPNMIWGGVKFVPGGHSSFFPFVNSFTHIIIYGYLTMIGTCGEVKKNFPWFRHFHTFLTAFEIIAILVHSLQLLVWNDCNFPIGFTYYILAYGTVYLVLSTFCHHNSKKDETDLISIYNRSN